MSRYNHQAIINLQRDNYKEPLWLQKRISKEQSIDVPLIIDINKNGDIPKIQHLDKNSRLYIFAHGGDNYSNIIADKSKDGTTWHYNELAALLNKNLPRLRDAEKEQGLFSKRLKISLMVCYAGYYQDSTKLNSFAGKLQKVLAEKYHIYVNINARVTLTVISTYTRKPVTYRLNSKKDYIEFNKNLLTLYEKQQYQAALILYNYYNIHKQPKSKIAFRFTTENERNDEVTIKQVAYDAYQLKEHENLYQELHRLIKRLKIYVKKRKNKPGYDSAVSAARNLAKKIESLTNIYFNKVVKSPNLTIKYKTTCINNIKSANIILEKNRDSLSKRIAGKALLAISNALIVPGLIHGVLVEKEVFSQGLFSNKTAGKQITENIENAIKHVKPITEVEEQPIEPQQKISLNLN